MSVGVVIEPGLERLVESITEPAVALLEPKKYRVMIYNDDFTPMNFVVLVLKRFFYLGESYATQLMLQVHVHGHAVCGVYTRDIAETKVALVNDYARLHEHPLLCIMEQE